MSLPKTFVDDDAYFRSVVDFLHTYSWVYNVANTSCIKALDCMPQEFKDYFLELSNENLNAFPFVHEPLEGCPENVQRFRQLIAKMTPQQTAASLPNLTSQEKRKCSNQYRKIGLKKLHEIEQLADKIHEHCAGTQTQMIIDLGSGLGYLSEALHKLKNNYLILGLEADEKRVESARQRCQKFLPQEALKSISYKTEFIKSDANSRARIEGYVFQLAQSHGLLPGLSTAIIGLHACADLSISAMILFLTMPQVRSLHIMPCCYHKLALHTENDRTTSKRSSPLLTSPWALDSATPCHQQHQWDASIVPSCAWPVRRQIHAGIWIPEHMPSMDVRCIRVLWQMPYAISMSWSESRSSASQLCHAPKIETALTRYGNSINCTRNRREVPWIGGIFMRNASSS